MAIVLRSTKGSALTYGEVDGNFSTLDTRTGSGWNDLVQDVTVPAGGFNTPSWTMFRNGIYAWAFASDAMNEVWTNFHIRHDYDITGGAYPGMIYPHVHFAVNTTSTGTVRWGVEYTCAQRHDDGVPGTSAFGATTTIYFEHVIDVPNQYVHHVSEATDGDGIAAGTVLGVDALVSCRYFRDGAHVNDTFPDPVFLLTVDAHYPVNILCTPNRLYPFT